MPKVNDPVRDFLRERGCADYVVEGGLAGLIESWEKTVQSVEDGYSLTLDDYLNDLDARQLIAEALLVASDDQRAEIAARLNRADEKMRSLTEPATVCLWGKEIAEEESWTAKDNWWYFARPVNADPELLAEIDEAVESGG
ncbi:MAG: hypothetical protein JMDDDDMK_02783 [Acidobacteria bacterium]|nr:hypothetical protein [Acidobacteriota bacterium]